MSDETHEAIPEALYDYKVLVGVALALVGIVIAYYFVRRYIPNETPTALRVVEQAEESEAGA